MSRTLPWCSRRRPLRCDSCIGGERCAADTMSCLQRQSVLQWAAGTVKKTMGWYGKLIGTILGYIIGRGWVGAIIGFLLGHQFDVATRGARRTAGGAIELSAAFFRATFQAMGRVAKADGHVT